MSADYATICRCQHRPYRMEWKCESFKPVRYPSGEKENNNLVPYGKYALCARTLARAEEKKKKKKAIIKCQLLYLKCHVFLQDDVFQSSFCQFSENVAIKINLYSNYDKLEPLQQNSPKQTQSQHIIRLI